MRAFLLLASLLTVTCVSVSLSAATWYVDASVSESGDGKSWATACQKIQDGVDTASHADTVTVAEGTYAENIAFNGKNIVLRSAAPSDPNVVAETIIDGKRRSSVVTFAGTEDETCVLEGFTIQGGRAEFGGGGAAAPRAARTHATI
ncbi:MAG: hypothetical protein Q8Q12_04755 [bacterium]|nr:hypothetical protein [bacterium]